MMGQVYGCGLVAALAVGGGKWKPIVPWHLAPAQGRFGELRRTRPESFARMAQND
jgi:DNA-binding HxlR family transcriptional regulator